MSGHILGRHGRRTVLQILGGLGHKCLVLQTGCLHYLQLWHNWVLSEYTLPLTKVDTSIKSSDIKR